MSTYPNASEGAPRGLDPTDLQWLRRLAHALVRDAAAAEDLAQDTALAALESRGPGGSPPTRAWLRSVARRLRARTQRDSIRRRDREQLRFEHGEAPSADELVRAAEAAERAVAAARALPEDLRGPVLQHFIEGLTPAQIAERSGQKPDTVRWRLRRGLDQMREALDRQDMGADPGRTPWALALAPFAIPTPDAGLAVMAASAASLPPTATLLPGLAVSMKIASWTCAALLVALSIAFFVGQGPGPESTSGAETIADRTVTPIPDLSPKAEADLATPAADAPQDRTTSPETGVIQEPGPAEDGRIAVRTVDSTGHPVEGATLYLAAAGSTVPSRILTSSDSGGMARLELVDLEPWLEEHGEGAELGAVANGYLRNTASVSEALAKREGPVELVLDSGVEMIGRVEDPDGRPVEGLRLLAHLPFPGSTHVSPSRVTAKGDDRNLAPGEATYSQCVETSGEGGAIAFRGLTSAEYAVRSLNPAWVIEAPANGLAGGPAHVWVAKRHFGVRVTAASDPAAPVGAPPLEFKTNFYVTLGYDEGRTHRTGKWVGAGRGSVTFTMTPEMLPEEMWDGLRSVSFDGVAKSAQGEAEWTSSTITLGDLESGKWSEAVATFERTETQEAPTPALPMARVEFDVRDAATGSPYSGPLSVNWSVANGPEGDDRATRQADGRYGFDVPAGKVTFYVRDSRSSGSLPYASAFADCAEGKTTTLFIDLALGGAARILRPADTSGEWFVRAQYRTSPDDEWFGAWNYSTQEDALVLTSLVAADWRFQIRAVPDGEPSEVRIAEVADGETVRVE